MTYIVIIPARFDSSRLPGKPLLDICGKPLIQHVYEQAIGGNASQVIIATDDDRIQATASGFGATVCMTRKEHLSGTDRLAEVVRRLDINDDEIVVNLQGDEPMMPAVLLDQVAEALKASSSASISTLCEPITRSEQVFDPNIVKVVTDHAGHALYFSRAPIPWWRDKYNHTTSAAVAPDTCFRHIGLYAYRVGFLKIFPQLPVCELEQAECLEQLRALFYGHRIKVDIASINAGIGIDTPADLDKVRLIFSQ